MSDITAIATATVFNKDHKFYNQFKENCLLDFVKEHKASLKGFISTPLTQSLAEFSQISGVNL